MRKLGQYKNGQDESLVLSVYVQSEAQSDFTECECLPLTFLPSVARKWRSRASQSSSAERVSSRD